jgi:hypothetical protein
MTDTEKKSQIKRFGLCRYCGDVATDPLLLQMCYVRNNRDSVEFFKAEALWKNACLECVRELAFNKLPNLQPTHAPPITSAKRAKKDENGPWLDNAIRAMEDN